MGHMKLGMGQGRVDRNRKRKRGRKWNKRGREIVQERNIVRARGIVKESVRVRVCRRVVVTFFVSTIK